MNIQAFSRKGVRFILISAITLIVFIVIFNQIDFLSVVEVLSRSNIYLLFIVFLLELIAILIKTRRWQLILKSIDYEIPFKRCFHVIMASFPFHAITPSKTGDLIKAVYLREEIPMSKTVGSVLTERVLDVMFLVAIVLVGLVFYPVLEIFTIVILILIVILFLFITQMFEIKIPTIKSWDEKIGNVFSSIKALPRNPRFFFETSLYSIIFWFVPVFQTILLFSALGLDVPILFVMANIPIAIFIGQIPVTLGGMGTRDAAIIVLFSEYANPIELLSVGILFSFFRYWLLAILGLLFIKKYIKA